VRKQLSRGSASRVAACFTCHGDRRGGYTHRVFRLTREVRFAINAGATGQDLAGRPSNSYGGWPSLTGAGQFFAIQVTVAGGLEPQTSYLLNIKRIDEVVRAKVVPLFIDRLRGNAFGSGADTLVQAFGLLKDSFPGVAVEQVSLQLSPFLGLLVRSTEHPMVRLSQKFEFSASHRLHNPSLGEEENRRSYGKCNNPHGHGHNYELQVTLVGETGDRGVLVDVPAFERIVRETVIDRLDHKNLNVEVPEFSQLIPSVENIAKVIYRLLEPRFAEQARLASVTVWETPKTWCEYSESRPADGAAIRP
jgi:6-pyruvoyltetrahydropterin/6-carboxytetrahydropterin synthase